MLPRTRKRVVAASVAIPAMLLLAGCGNGMAQYLDNNRVQYSEASVQDVFGEQWTEFAVQCPGEGPEDIAAKYGVNQDDVENLSDREDYQYVYLRNDEGETGKEDIKVEDAVICEPASEAGIEFTEWLPADLAFKYEKATPQDDWVLDAEALQTSLDELNAEREERDRERDEAEDGDAGEDADERPSESPSPSSEEPESPAA